jgi:hypothetical protein
MNSGELKKMGDPDGWDSGECRLVAQATRSIANIEQLVYFEIK